MYVEVLWGIFDIYCVNMMFMVDIMCGRFFKICICIFKLKSLFGKLFLNELYEFFVVDFEFNGVIVDGEGNEKC